jgi:hypothetical protein
VQVSVGHPPIDYVEYILHTTGLYSGSYFSGIRCRCSELYINLRKYCIYFVLCGRLRESTHNVRAKSESCHDSDFVDSFESNDGRSYHVCHTQANLRIYTVSQRHPARSSPSGQDSTQHRTAQHRTGLTGGEVKGIFI